MMKEEFERLAGYEVTAKDYDEIIEPMYMAVELNKVDFIKCIDRKRFEVKRETEAGLIKKLKAIAKIAFEKCGHVENFCEKMQMDEIVKMLGQASPTKFYYTETGYECEAFKIGCTYYKSLVIEDCITGKSRRVKLV